MNDSTHDSLEMHSDGQGVWTVWFDSPNRGVNLFDADMLAALESAVDRLSTERNCRAIIFRSRKPDCFFAGADVKAIAGLHDASEVRAIIDRGQKLMQRVADLPMPTMAVIDGACMGGGLEFALACRYRLASDSAATKLGLPEIRLGLIPGWGGTQRLPHCIGLQPALGMILKGSGIPAGKAKRLGLVDRVVPRAALDHEISQLIADQPASAGVPPQGRIQKYLEATALGRNLILALAQRKLRSQFKHYPALRKALQAVSCAYPANPAGYAYERDAFTELLFTPTAQSLLGLFVQRDAAKKAATWLPQAASLKPHAVHRLAIVGAGAMGAGIGALAATKGMQVVFKEIDTSAANAGSIRFENILQEQLDQKRLTAEEQQQAFQRTTFATDWLATSDCDLAIEAVLEIPHVKRDVFRELDASLPPHASLASNTSSLSVTQMASVTARRGQVAGLHFFNPVQRMELVEVVRTEMTEEVTLAQLLNLVRTLGKTPLVTSDKPGFLVNRVLFPYLGEAVRMVAEGRDIQVIDHELKRFGMPMGPCELMDQVGIDVASHVASSLAAIQPEAAQPADFLNNMQDSGWLGKKSGRGFYVWQKRRKVNGQLAQPGATTTSEELDYRSDGLSSIQRRLVYPMLNEAVHCLDELVVTEPWMVDLGMVLGTGFAPWSGGPLRLIDLLGVDTVLANLQKLERRFGRRFAPADGLVSRAARHKTFFPPALMSDPQTQESHHESGCTTES